MQIKSARQVHKSPSPRGFVTLGKFNIQITEDIMICDCNLVRPPDGNIILYGPGRENNTLSVSPALRREIIEMALDALGMNVNDRQYA